ncbi:MAG: 2-amino-4-hydroxy-6-hydroxymethyldihydropteridine diphosphokinase [Deltaproteobacteria bacterium]|nr:2-amino-4-hydroxy-6-hydroxymethyldihydropteridine diphosphokinase [Deltaproteobacteria bacterium]
MARAYIALGANLGDRALAIEQATLRLGRAGHVYARSRILETAPVGPVADQPAFLNCMVALDTGLSPHALLATCLAIERELGRDRGTSARPQGPRTIDLDIVAYDDLQLDTPTLKLPHPALHHRGFWRIGLLEVGARIRALLDS